MTGPLGNRSVFGYLDNVYFEKFLRLQQKRNNDHDKHQTLKVVEC